MLNWVPNKPSDDHLFLAFPFSRSHRRGDERHIESRIQTGMIPRQSVRSQIGPIGLFDGLATGR